VRSWTVADGLPQNTVTDIAERDDGLWLTTFEGLTRFDGHRFRNVPITDTDGRAVLRLIQVEVHPTGDLWVGSQRQGLYFGPPSALEPVEGAPDFIIHLALGDDAAWVVGDAALFRCPFEPTPPRCESIRGVHPTAKLQSVDAAVFLREPDHTERLAGPTATAAPTWDYPASPSWLWDAGSSVLRNANHADWELEFRLPPRVVLDRGAQTWIGSETQGLLRVRESHVTRVPFDRGGALLIAIEPTGRVIAAPSGPGLYAVDSSAPTGTLRAEPFEGFDQHVTSLTVGPDGRVWGTIGRGPFAIEGPRVVPLDLDTPGVVKTLVWDAGQLWGLSATTPDEDPNADAWLWRQTQSRLERWPLPFPLAPTRLAADGTGGAWAGSEYGLWHFDGAEWSEILIEGRRTAEVRDILRIPGSTPPADGGPLPVFVATYGDGLLRVEHAASEWRIDRWGPAQGLCDDAISRIVPTEHELWINSNRGVFYIPLHALNGGASKQLPCALVQSGEGNGGGPGHARTPDGHAWFPTISGLARVETRARANQTPRPRIDALRLGDEVVADGAVIGPDPGPVTIEVSAVSLDSDLPPQFRHRLLGADTAWSYPGTAARSTWSSLPPGTYRFEVQSRTRGDWSEPASITFRVRPAWSELPAVRLGFGAGALASAVIVALLLVRWRTTWLARRNATLQQSVAKLGEAADRLRTLFDAASNGLILHGPDGRIVEANPAACTLTDRPRSALVGALPESFVSSGLEAYRALLDAPASAEVTIGTHVLQLQSRPLSLDGQTHVLISASDLTEIRARQAEQARRTASERQDEFLRATSQLAGGIAEDVNDLLSVIVGEVDLLAFEIPDIEPRIDGIRRASDRGALLTRQLAAFARIGSAEPRRLDPGAAVEALLPTLRRVLPESIDIHLDGDAPGVRIAPAQLNEVLLHLALNARDAMPDGGQLRIDLGHRQVDVGLAGRRGVPPGNYATIEVSDTGEGIPAPLLGRVFDVFFTTRDPEYATGLGLSAVQAAIRAANGFVEVRSTVGEGTAFRIHLPAHSLSASIAPTPLVPAELTGVKVLLCATDARVRDVVAQLLLALGCDVRKAEGAGAALRSMALQTDVLLADKQLDSMTGARLAERCRQIRPHLGVVILTPVEDDDLEWPTLAKPVSHEALALAVTAVLPAVNPPRR
jgi:signal transduction histidine kinase